MENKRSTGVTIFAWLFIISSVFGLLSLLRIVGQPGQICPLAAGSSNMASKFTATSQIWRIYSFVAPALGLMAGIFILMLKDWARKLEITLRLVSIIFIFIMWLPVLNLTHSAQFHSSLEKAAEARKAEIKKVIQPEYQEKLLKKEDEVMRLGEKSASFGFYLIFALGLAWNAFIIFYFTRPRVREQFVFLENQI